MNELPRDPIDAFLDSFDEQVGHERPFQGSIPRHVAAQCIRAILTLYGGGPSDTALAEARERLLGILAQDRVIESWSSFDALVARILEIAAGSGSAEARFRLGIMYLEGRGVEQHDGLGTTWLDKAADDFHPGAQYHLGLAYLNGRGQEQNLQEAAYYLERAAEAGVTEAMYEVGLLYRQGCGVARDLGKAGYWLRKAAKKGHYRAGRALRVDSSDARSEKT